MEILSLCNRTFRVLLDDVIEELGLPYGDTNLHRACKYGNHECVKEIIKTKPSYVGRLNNDGFSPLHLAAENGLVEIVRELLNFNRALCLVKDRKGRNPLHCAAIAGQVNVVFEMLTNFYGEELVKCRDQEGNTILHIAVINRHLSIVELLIKENPFTRKWVDINSVNTAGFTPLDLASSRSSNHFDLEIKEMIKEAGGRRGQEMIKSGTSSYKKSFVHSPLKMEEHSKRQLKLMPMLSVAVLIAGHTFQAGLNPPRAVIEEEIENKTYQHLILFRLFMFFNSASFLTSIAVVIITSLQLVLGQALLLFSVISMVGSYVCSVITIGRSAGYDVFVLAVPLLLFVAFHYVLLLKKNVGGKENEEDMFFERQKLCSVSCS